MVVVYDGLVILCGVRCERRDVSGRYLAIWTNGTFHDERKCMVEYLRFFIRQIGALSIRGGSESSNLLTKHFTRAKALPYSKTVPPSLHPFRHFIIKAIINVLFGGL